MLTVTTRSQESTSPMSASATGAGVPTLYLSFELGTTWMLAFTSGLGQRPRKRGMAARTLDRLDDELARAKRRFCAVSRYTIIAGSFASISSSTAAWGLAAAAT